MYLGSSLNFIFPKCQLINLLLFFIAFRMTANWLLTCQAKNIIFFQLLMLHVNLDLQSFCMCTSYKWALNHKCQLLKRFCLCIRKEILSDFSMEFIEYLCLISYLAIASTCFKIRVLYFIQILIRNIFTACILFEKKCHIT